MDSGAFYRATISALISRLDSKRKCQTKSGSTHEDGRKVKFIYQELPEDGVFITAQLAGNEVVYSVVLTEAKNPLSRDDVESRFKGELSKK